MVFYTCSGCGEALKKNKVEKHVYTCRGCEYLTCIDCGKDFYEDEYKNHNQCITEDQKYSAKGTKFKPNKGDVKQQQWLQNIENVVSSSVNLSKKARDLISNLKNYDNIPRKRPKFLNFLKNSLRIYDAKVGEEVWEAFSAASKKETPGTTAKSEEVSQKLETTSGFAKKSLEIASETKSIKGNEAESVNKKDNKRKLAPEAEDVQTENPVKKKKKRKLVQEEKSHQAEDLATKDDKCRPCEDHSSPKSKKKKLKKSKKETKVEKNLVHAEVEESTKTSTSDKSGKESKKKKRRSVDQEDAASCHENIDKKQKNNNLSHSVNSEQADGNREKSDGLENNSVTVSSTTGDSKTKKKKKKSKKVDKGVAGEIIPDGGDVTAELILDDKSAADNTSLQKPRKKKKPKHSDEENKNGISDSNNIKKKIKSGGKDGTTNQISPLSNGAVVKGKKKSKRKKVDENLRDTNGENVIEDIPVSKKKKKKKHKTAELVKDAALDR